MKRYRARFRIFDDEGETIDTSTVITAGTKDEAYRNLLSHYYNHEIGNVVIDEIKISIKTKAAEAWEYYLTNLNMRLERRKERKESWNKLSLDERELRISRIVSKRIEQYYR
jgi:hypothetical protein